MWGMVRLVPVAAVAIDQAEEIAEERNGESGTGFATPKWKPRERRIERFQATKRTADNREVAECARQVGGSSSRIAVTAGATVKGVHSTRGRAVYSLWADQRQVALDLRIVHVARRLEVKLTRITDLVFKAFVQKRERIRETAHGRNSGRIVGKSSLRARIHVCSINECYGRPVLIKQRHP